ncbi:BPSS1780 family membrane protein [Caenimonas aquaedulcis]|uniref:DUF2189 domain-containing protein n=1 Tax=Caenimonas aquaedulcis TaxID=2793270 RepID=A0A931H7Y4_9BURK|nr:BPSS1780 family membrane protein [Caenimonas aquaedulcis]MBG9390369.1 hypothetical protein [Caenimonas aquaedulcis]
MKLNIVPARTGVLWVRLGIRTFMRQPLAFSVLFFVYMAAALLLSAIPVIGPVLGLAIVPAATLGLMAATREAEDGRFPTPTVLLSAFRAGRQRVRAMMILGLIYTAAWLAIAAFVHALVDVPPQPVPAQGAAGPAMLSPEFQLSMLLMMVLFLPVSVMFWHAPALVHWHGVSPLKSLFFSTVACMRNFKAFFMYGLAWMGVFFALFFVGSLLAGAIALVSGNPQLGAVVLMPLMILLGAMFTTSLYFTFRDSFVATPELETPSPGESP